MRRKVPGISTEQLGFVRALLQQKEGNIAMRLRPARRIAGGCGHLRPIPAGREGALQSQRMPV